MHREGEAPLTGRLSIALPEVIRLVGSLRADDAGAIRAPLRFGGFFVLAVVAASFGWKGPGWRGRA